jgi:hypothetical protein
MITSSLLSVICEKLGSEATSVSQYHMIVQGLGLAAEVLELRLRLVASARFTCIDR